MACAIVVSHWYGVVEVAAHKGVVLGEVDVKAIVGGEHHIAVARLYDARHNDAAQAVSGKVGIHLPCLLVYAAGRLVAERHPHPTIAVGIYIAHLVAGQGHIGDGCAVVLNRAQRATVYLVHTIVVAKPYIAIAMAQHLALCPGELRHYTELVRKLVEHKEVASANPQIAVAVVGNGPYHVAALANQGQGVVAEAACGYVVSRQSLIVHSHPHRILIGCHRHNVVAPHTAVG